MEKQDIQRLAILVETLMLELKSIKRRKYFRDYYRQHREKIDVKAKQKQKELSQECLKHKTTDGFVYFD